MRYVATLKYEMLCRVRKEGRSVTEAAAKGDLTAEQAQPLIIGANSLLGGIDARKPPDRSPKSQLLAVLC